MEIKARPPPVTAPAATEPTSSAIDERLLQFRALEEARKEREELERKKRLLEQQRQRQDQEREMAERRAAEEQLRIARERVEAASREQTSQRSAEREYLGQNEPAMRREPARAPADEGRWERAKPPPPSTITSTRQPGPR